MSAETRIDRGVVARELVLVEQLAHFQLDELEELLVVDHVDLVERDHDRRHADLTGEQHVLTRLGHRAVGGGDHEDRTVDLRRTGDHVLDVVGVAGHVDVRVVPRFAVSYSTWVMLIVIPRSFSSGRLVDLVERGERGALRVLFGASLGDGRGQRRLAVVDVTHGADVEVRLVALELRLWPCPC